MAAKREGWTKVDALLTRIEEDLRASVPVVAVAKRINPIVAIPKERKKRGRIGS